MNTRTAKHQSLHVPPKTASPPAQMGILPDLSLLGVALIWGVNIPLMKSGLDQLENVFIFNALRLPISALVLCIFAWRERRRGVFPHHSVTWMEIAFYSVMISAVYQICFLVGMSLTTPGNTALIIATVPIWTALLAKLFLGESIRRLAWCGLMLAVAGTVIVAVQKGVSVDSKHLWGNLTVLFSALLWAAGTVYSRPLLNRITPMQLAASAHLMALPIHILIAVALFVNSEQTFASLSPLRSLPLWLIIIYSGSLSSGLSQPMWHFGVKQAGASHAAVVQNLVPVFALLAAWVISREVPTQPQAIGGSLILAGLITMRIARR